MNFLSVKKIIKQKKEICAFLFFLLLWLMIWATYNTDIFRMFSPGFPHNTFDLIHGLRSILPFVAIVLAVIFLFKKKNVPKSFFLTPLGLLGIFTILGIISSVFSSSPLVALYWGVMYGSVIIVLLAVLSSSNPLKKLSFIININWVIASVLTIGLFIFFLIQPGAISSLTLNFLVCGQRLYESTNNIRAEINTFGMAGTRPTGLGRYAGITAIIALVIFFYKKRLAKTAWFLLFFISLLILLFAKGRTEIIAFVAAMIFVVWLMKKINIISIFGVFLICLVSFFTIVYNIPCSNSFDSLAYFIPHISLSNPFAPKNVEPEKPAPAPEPEPAPAPAPAPAPEPEPAPAPAPAPAPEPEPAPAPAPAPAPEPPHKSTVSIITLGGRTSGVWLDAWHLFLSSPLIGRGFQADRFFLNGQHAHNSIIHALIQTGVLGTACFISALILTFIILLKLFRRPDISEKEKSFLIVISAALVFFAVRSITESLVFFSADWLFVAPIIAYIQCLDNKINENDNSKNSVFNFSGNKINLISVQDAVKRICSWIKEESSKIHWVVVTGMHGVVESQKHFDFKRILNSADLFVPDGISLVWLARSRGFNVKNRVSGSDLMQKFFSTAEKEGFSSYFYGDSKETLEELNKKLLLEFPNLKIAGSYSPPFRELTQEEDKKIIENINNVKPDVLWVALGLPKQEKWIFCHKNSLRVPVIIGVGAAFKFLSGRVRRAPKWIGNMGFEWLWRLIFEPKTTWKRVFFDMPIFFWLVIKDSLKFDKKN